MKHFTTLLLLYVFSYLNVQAQEIFEVKRVGTIEVDGKVDEVSWFEVEPLPMTVYTPEFKGELTEKTEVRIAYDDNYLYVSGVFYDSKPEGIQGNSLIRDGNPGGDFFNVLLDTYNDNENFSTFSTMPSGNRLDAEILNDAEGEQEKIFNSSWNTFWDVKTTQDEQGWYAEMRIPFSSLRFNDNNGEVIFGFITHRLIGRKNERQTFPAIAPDWPMAAWKPSQARKIKLKGIKRKNAVYVTPYVLGGYEQVASFDASSDEINSRSDFNGEAGLDVKLTPGSNLGLDLTLNTDFAQVEADNVQVNLSRFSLFFPEKRQFFQERSGVFSFQTSLSSQNRLFHSRRIGLDENGNPLRVYGGVRMVGRSKGLDLGLLNMQAEALGQASSENFGVLRVRKRVVNPYSYIGAITTTRVNNNGNYNVVIGADALFRLSSLYYLTTKFGRVEMDSSSSNDKYMGYLKWERRASTGLGFTVEMERAGSGFDPGLGFILRKNTAFNQSIVYGVFVDHSWIRKISPFVNNYLYFDNEHLELESNNLESGIEASFKSGAALSLSWVRNYDETLTGFQLSDEVQVMQGRYNYQSFKVNYSMSPGRRLRFGLASDMGEFYDGKKYVLSFSPTWNPSKHFEMNLNYTLNRVEFNNRDQYLNADLFSASVLVALDTHWSLRSLVQYSELTKDLAINTTIRFNKKEGNDLYLVWNQLNNNQQPVVDGAINSNLNFKIKYTYTFLW